MLFSLPLNERLERCDRMLTLVSCLSVPHIQVSEHLVTLLLYEYPSNNLGKDHIQVKVVAKIVQYPLSRKLTRTIVVPIVCHGIDIVPSLRPRLNDVIEFGNLSNLIFI